MQIPKAMNILFLIVIVEISRIYCIGDFPPDLSLHKSWNFLRQDICGQSASFRIIGGKNATLGAYPWIARIGYVTRNNKTPDFKCGAVVINERTVLTAAHCVHNLPAEYKTGVIRVGEHMIASDPDCEDGVCAEPVQDMKPKEIIIHEFYDKPLYKNDIAIVRLEGKINFTTYVKPICLLKSPLIYKNYTGALCEVAGWGIYDIGDPKPSVILQAIHLAVVNNQQCYEAFRKYAEIGETQMCVGGNPGEDSCGGDSGGPLMKIEDSELPPRYYLLGIVSFGAKKCGFNQMPGVYTRVSSFMPWILDNLEKNTNNFKKVM